MFKPKVCDFYWRHALFTSFLVCILSPAFSQIDSLKVQLASLVGKDRVPLLERLAAEHEDSTSIPYLLELSTILYKSEPTAAFRYAWKAKRLSQHYRDQFSLAIAYSRIARIYFSPKLQYDSARWAVDHALQILQKGPPCKELGQTYNTAGIINADQGNLAVGIAYFKKAEEIFIQIQDHCWATTIHHNIGKLYKYSNQFEMAKKYFLECLELFKRNDCAENYDYLFLNLGSMYAEEGDYAEALKYLHEGLQVSKRMEHHEGIGGSLLMIGKVHRKLNEFSKAENRFREALEIGSHYSIHKLTNAANYELATLFMKIGQHSRAKTYIDQGIELAQKTGKLVYISTGYELLHEYYTATGNSALALENYKNHIHIRDSMEAQKVEMKIASLEGEKKQNQIALLNKENEIIDLRLNRSKTYNYLLVGISVAGLSLTYILFRNYLHRQNVKTMEFKKRSNEKIIDMERRILASVIETENRERKRFAADLHDSLGPLLSSAKLYLGEITETSEGEQLELAKSTQEIVDAAIVNAREISNNIIPTSLGEMGLFNSLQEFCEKIERIRDIQFVLDYNLPSTMRLNPGLEVVLYRVLTELINNTVKHADAKVVHIGFAAEQNNLDITYCDNGKGFEVQKVLEKSEHGMGLYNIKSRISDLHGDIQIKSKKDKGTEIDIHVPI